MKLRHIQCVRKHIIEYKLNKTSQIVFIYSILRHSLIPGLKFWPGLSKLLIMSNFKWTIIRLQGFTSCKHCSNGSSISCVQYKDGTLI